MFIRKFCLTAAMLALSTASHAAVTVFSDNFDADRTSDNATQFLKGWTVTDGTVDIDGKGFVHDEMPGHGHYVDLDGSTKRAGVFGNSIAMVAGSVYTLSFDLAGNQRNWGADTVDVQFGTTKQTYVLGAAAPLSARTLTFAPTASGSYAFSFRNRGGDNRGAFLDNVSITAVPEPETYLMLLAGLAGLAVQRRRKQRQSESASH